MIVAGSAPSFAAIGLLALVATAACAGRVASTTRQSTPSSGASVPSEAATEVDLGNDDASVLGPNIVAVGDSITYGSQTADAGSSTSYPYFVSRDLGLAFDVNVFNRGVPGTGTENLPDVDYLLSRKRPNHLLIHSGGNDFYAAKESPATTLAWLADYVREREAHGWIVTVLTLTGRGTVDDAASKQAAAYDTLLRQTFPRVVDAAADPDIGHDATIPNPYFSVDAVHLSELGNARLATLVSDFLSRDNHLASDRTAVPLTSFGVRRDPSLTAWFRDWNTINTIEPTVFDLNNIASGRLFRRHLVLAGSSTPPKESAHGLGVHPTVSFPGNTVDDLAFYQSSALLSDFFSADNLEVHALIKPEEVVANDPLPYSNDGVISDGATAHFGIFLRSVAPGRANVIAYVHDGDLRQVELPIPLGTWSLVSMRLAGGMLGLRLGADGTWLETPAGPIADLTGPLRVGRNATVGHAFHGELADLMIRNRYDDAVDLADRTYFKTRYALP